MSETTVTDELARLTETPSMGLPRETLLALAMSARSISGALRTIRENNGRAAWNPADEAARIHLAADAASIDRLTIGQAAEWNQRVADGEVTLWSDRRPGGLSVSEAVLSDESRVLQATLGDRTVTVSPGSEQTAQHLRDWLIANPTHDALSDLRDASREVANHRTRGRGAAAHAVVDEPIVHEVDADDATVSESGPALRDLLEGRVPDRAFDDPRWPVAENAFADAVARGANRDELVESAAALNIDDKVRTPAGLIAWQIRRTAQGMTGSTDEEQARREAAAEWLTTASESPTDRARAATLVGQVDEDFDRELAQKYPGILTGDVEAQWHDHNSRARVHEDLAAEHADTIDVINADRVDDDAVAVMHGPTDAQADAEIATEYSDQVADADYAADERDARSLADSARAHDAASAAESASAAPLTRGRGATAGSGKRTPPRPAATRQPTNSQTRTRNRTL